jgi:hypothetical protein
MSTFERQEMMLPSNSGKRKTLVEAGMGVGVGSVGGADTARRNGILEAMLEEKWPERRYEGCWSWVVGIAVVNARSAREIVGARSCGGLVVSGCVELRSCWSVRFSSDGNPTIEYYDWS